MNRPSRRTALAYAAAASPTAHRVEIRKFRFDPDRLSVRPGDTVTWTNRDIAPHTATARDGGWDTGTLQRGESATIAVEPGMAADYYCRHHPMMKAALSVDPASRSRSPTAGDAGRVDPCQSILLSRLR